MFIDHFIVFKDLFVYRIVFPLAGFSACGESAARLYAQTDAASRAEPQGEFTSHQTHNQ